MFKDPYFESMNYLEQLLQPYIYEANKILDLVPNEIELNLTNLTYSRFDINDDLTVLSNFVKEKDIYKVRGRLTFKPYCEDNTIININTKTIETGKISYIVNKEYLDQEEGKEYFVNLIYAFRLYNIVHNNSYLQLERIIKLSKLLFKETSITRRTKMSKACYMFESSLVYALRNWDIRRDEVIFKLLDWIKSYIIHDDMSAYTNICSLKSLTSTSSHPIYSVEEVE